MDNSNLLRFWYPVYQSIRDYSCNSWLVFLFIQRQNHDLIGIGFIRIEILGV
jgi:hypothetical protein